MPITAPSLPRELSVPEFDDIVQIYDLRLLMEDADFSLENGDFALTKDGDMHSVGVVINAAANGFRHADEWAKTRPSTTQQRASQDILNALPLGGRRLSTVRLKADEPSPGRYVEVLQLISGGDFEGLARNIFAFAHDLALRVRSRTDAR